MNLKSSLLKFAVVGTRLFLGLIFFTSGIGKLTGGDYPGLIGPVHLEEWLAPYGLGLWVKFVAWSQITVGLLLLSQRFATVGAIMLLPMIANILIVTVSLKWQGTPYVNGFLLGLNLFLLAADYHKIKFLFFEDVQTLRQMPIRRSYAMIDALWLAGFVLCLGSAALYPVNRLLTYGLSLAGMLLFIGCAVWQFLSRRRLNVPPAPIESVSD
jgi:uncharacterized membrane protein YphA (DoxX/SURF4 family)